MAIIDLHEADTALSLSRMDRVIFCFILEAQLPPELLSFLIQNLARKFNLDDPPLMIYPHTYVAKHGIKVSGWPRGTISCWPVAGAWAAMPWRGFAGSRTP